MRVAHYVRLGTMANASFNYRCRWLWVPAFEPVKKSSQFPANCDSMEMLAEPVFEGS
jgi:hypothetical protein